MKKLLIFKWLIRSLSVGVHVSTFNVNWRNKPCPWTRAVPTNPIPSTATGPKEQQVRFHVKKNPWTNSISNLTLTKTALNFTQFSDIVQLAGISVTLRELNWTIVICISSLALIRENPRQGNVNVIQLALHNKKPPLSRSKPTKSHLREFPTPSSPFW